MDEMGAVDEQKEGLMWRIALLVAVFVAGMHAVFAEEAVLNNPPAAVSVLKTVVKTLDPSYETVWDWAGGTWSQGVSGSLYNFKSNGIHLASARLGYATGETFYGSVGLDLPGLASRFVPTTIKGIATVAPLDTLWSVVGKYARVGGFGGYTWNSKNRMAYGMTFGAALNF